MPPQLGQSGREASELLGDLVVLGEAAAEVVHGQVLTAERWGYTSISRSWRRPCGGVKRSGYSPVKQEVQ